MYTGLRYAGFFTFPFIPRLSSILSLVIQVIFSEPYTFASNNKVKPMIADEIKVLQNDTQAKVGIRDWMLVWGRGDELEFLI